MFSNLPLPKPGHEILAEGFSKMLDRMVKQRELENTHQYQQGQLGMKGQELAETGKYHQGELGIQQQKENRENRESPFNIDLIKAKIKAENELAEWRKRGGNSALSGSGKEEKEFQSLIAKDNPGLSPDQIYEASNVLREGGNQLADGTRLNPLSPASKQALEHKLKGTTYSGAVVPLIKANQAEAELKTLMEMSNKDFEPFATTYAGYSVPQIISTFKNDDKSQEKLGNFIASQAAQYEASQIRNRIAGGEPGISATQELMGKSGQIIKTLYPRLSAKARMQATKRLDEYLEAGLKARRSVGIGISSATNNQSSENSKNNDPLGIL